MLAGVPRPATATNASGKGRSTLSQRSSRQGGSCLGLPTSPGILRDLQEAVATNQARVQASRWPADRGRCIAPPTTALTATAPRHPRPPPPALTRPHRSPSSRRSGASSSAFCTAAR